MHPLVYEINTRCWLRELSELRSHPVTLAGIPDTEFDRWQEFGFTHIWLMGVWKTGPRTRAEALKTPEQRAQYLEALPDYREEDIQASPYAIADYSVADIFGGDTALNTFRQKLNRRGLKLILDFVPNHLGLDHLGVVKEPDLFVQSPTASPLTFQQKTSQGTRWLAHGKDPYFPPWTDTVQLDYRRRATQGAMLDILGSVAERCDGVRCDMAMLLLNEVFAKNWAAFPISDPEPSFEFWESAISTVKATHPDFLFLAEVYWGLEEKLQSLGFDFTYDKELYDRIVSHDAPGVQRHLLSQPIKRVAASAHFLENHDERRIASLLSLPEHRAAALLISTLPGMRLLHEGQLTGTTRRLPVQLARRSPEAPQSHVVEMYERLLEGLEKSGVGEGNAELLRPQKATDTDSTFENIILIQWQSEDHSVDFAVINLSSRISRCVATSEALSSWEKWNCHDLLAEKEAPAPKHIIKGKLSFELTPFEGQLLRFERLRDGNAAAHIQPVAQVIGAS